MPEGTIIGPSAIDEDTEIVSTPSHAHRANARRRSGDGANIKNFSDFDGQTIEITGYVLGMKNAEFAAAFPGVKGFRYDGYEMQVGRVNGALVPITRKVNMKARPSLHECDARCMGATGRTMNCECSCGGKNHGRGNLLTCEAA